MIGAIEKRARTTLVFLDACRDNPLAEELQRSAKGASRTAATPRGLAPIEIRNPDTLVVFAAAPGKTAADGPPGSNSPFASALIRNITDPGVEIELMLKRVTRDVVQATHGRQVPERLSRLTTELVLKPATAVLGPAQSALVASVAPPPVTAVPPSARPLPAPTERPVFAEPATPAPKTDANGCLLVGSRLPSSIPVTRGERLCAEDSSNSAVIKKVSGSSVVYAVNGGYEISCRASELCGFNWPGGPLFTVRLIPPGTTSGAGNAWLEPAR